MLHIILLLLKIIGILLLCILGLILLILLTTLLVPIRYRLAIEHGAKLFYLKGSVSWLLHAINVGISHIEGTLHIKARVFGFVVYDNLKPRKPKKSKMSKKAKISKSTKQKTSKSHTDKSKATMRNSEKKDTVPELISSYPESRMVNESKAEDERVEQPTTLKFEQRELIKRNELIGQASSAVHQTVMERKEPKTENKSFIQRLFDRIRGVKDKVVSTLLEWKVKISQIFATASSFHHKLRLILDFLKDEMNKDGMHLTFFSLKKLLKHILPTKLKSKLIFGTGDPCSTGQALGAMSIVYSFYGDKIQITPDFEQEILEGKHFARGRIRLVTILIIVVKLILDKRFKQLKNNFIILKEAL